MCVIIGPLWSNNIDCKFYNENEWSIKDCCCIFVQGYLKMIKKVSLNFVNFYFVFVLCLQNTLDCLLYDMFKQILCDEWLFYSLLIIFYLCNWLIFLYNLIEFFITFINFIYLNFLFILHFVCRVNYCFVLIMSRYDLYSKFGKFYECFYHVFNKFFIIFYIQTFMSDLLIIILTGPIGPMNDI